MCLCALWWLIDGDGCFQLLDKWREWVRNDGGGFGSRRFFVFAVSRRTSPNFAAYRHNLGACMFCEIGYKNPLRLACEGVRAVAVADGTGQGGTATKEPLKSYPVFLQMLFLLVRQYGRAAVRGFFACLNVGGECFTRTDFRPLVSNFGA